MSPPTEEALSRIGRGIDHGGLNPALKKMTRGELATCLWVYTYLNARARWPGERRKLKRKLEAADKAARLPPPMAELNKIRDQLEWHLMWGPGVLFPADDLCENKWLDPRPYLALGRAQKVSAFEVLVGMLRDVFEKHCGPARRGRNSNAKDYAGQYTGQFINFVDIVLQVLEIRNVRDALPGGAPYYSIAAIERAFNKARRAIG